MSGPESSKPDDQLLDDFLAGQGAVREAYRAMAQEQAPAQLDASILKMAQAEARPQTGLRRSRWQMPVAAAAVVVLSFGVLLQTQRDPAVQDALMAVPQRSASAAVVPKPDSAKAEVLAETAPVRAAADVEMKLAPAVAARPKPAPPTEKRRAAAADAAPKPAPAPPAMAIADTPAPPAVAQATEPVAPAMTAESLGQLAAAEAGEPMQRQQRFVVAPAPMSKAARAAGQSSLLAAPSESEQAKHEAGQGAVAKQLHKCAALASDQVPVIANSAGAIKAAKAVLSRHVTPEHLARYEPFVAELRGDLWHIYGALPPDMNGGVPEVEVCRSTGEVLTVMHGQ